MSTILNVMHSEPLDLSFCEEFMGYYHTPNSFTKHIIEKEINNGHYTDPDFLKIFDNNDAVVIDGGTNIGLFTLHLQKACRKIFSVEPTVKHLNILRTISGKLNFKNIEFFDVAFSNYTGECSFIVDNANTTQNRIQDGGDTIKCITILDFIENCGENTINLLKIDIEGGERLAILEDPTFAEVSKYCENIYIELHPWFVDANSVIAKITDMGYTAKYMNSEFLNNNQNILFMK